MHLNDFYSKYKWKLQLVVWAVTMTVVCLLVVRQCLHRPTPQGCSAAMTDSLQHIDAPGCQQKDYKGFRVYFDANAHLPRCVIYELTADETLGQEPRAKDFAQDTSVKGCPTPRDYAGSGMDRGHMVPAGDLKWDSTAMLQSFLMTNICPQDKSLNEGGWNRLEEKAREWARRDGAIIIAAGPVIEAGLQRTDAGVLIPRRYFKVVLTHQSQPMHAVAFVYANAPCNGPLRQYAVSVDSVERITGIDFFSALPNEVERDVEQRNDLTLFLMPRDW